MPVFSDFSDLMQRALKCAYGWLQQDHDLYGARVYVDDARRNVRIYLPVGSVAVDQLKRFQDEIPGSGVIVKLAEYEGEPCLMLCWWLDLSFSSAAQGGDDDTSR